MDEFSRRQALMSELLRAGVEPGTNHSIEALEAMLSLVTTFEMDIGMLLADGAKDEQIIQVYQSATRLLRPDHE
jgi:hypothetical protein